MLGSGVLGRGVCDDGLGAGGGEVVDRGVDFLEVEEGALERGGEVDLLAGGGVDGCDERVGVVVRVECRGREGGDVDVGGSGGGCHGGVLLRKYVFCVVLLATVKAVGVRHRSDSRWSSSGMIKSTFLRWSNELVKQGIINTWLVKTFESQSCEVFFLSNNEIIDRLVASAPLKRQGLRSTLNPDAWSSLQLRKFRCHFPQSTGHR